MTTTAVSPLAVLLVDDEPALLRSASLCLRAASGGKNYSHQWAIQGVGDFNGDGRADIVWRSTWGTMSIWLMNGGWYIGESAPLPMDTAWQLGDLLPLGTQRLDLQ